MAARFGMKLNVSGVYVYKVIAGGPLDQAGLRHGDVITQVGDTTIEAFTDLQDALSKARPGDTVTVTFNRNGSSQSANVVLQEAPADEEDNQ